MDRLWAVHLTNRIKFQRNKLSLTILIGCVFLLVFIANLINLSVDSIEFSKTISSFNPALNKTEYVQVIYQKCYHFDIRLKLIQDFVFAVMRVLAPFTIMTVCSVVLIVHLSVSRARVEVHRLSANQLREKKFTLAVCITNVAFFVLNISYVMATVVTYVYNLNHSLSWSRDSLIAFQIISILLSYVFTLIQFWLDLVFNRFFRKELSQVVMRVFG